MTSYLGPSGYIDTMRLLRAARETGATPWLPPIPGDEELMERLESGPVADVLDNDQDCLQDGWNL